MIKFMDLLADPEYQEREIIYIIHLRLPIGVIGYECTQKIKNCQYCTLLKSCMPIMVDAPAQEETPENSQIKTKKTKTANE